MPPPVITPVKATDVVVKNTQPVPVTGSVTVTAAKGVFRVQPQGAFNVNAFPGGTRYQVAGEYVFGHIGSGADWVHIVPEGHTFVIESISTRMWVPVGSKSVLAFGFGIACDAGAVGASSTGNVGLYTGLYEVTMPLELMASNIRPLLWNNARPHSASPYVGDHDADLYAGTVETTLYAAESVLNGPGSMKIEVTSPVKQELGFRVVDWSLSGYLLTP